MKKTKKYNSGACRRRVWITVCSVLLALLVISPVIVLILGALILPPVYCDTFLGELGEKYRLLNETDEPKVVVVGGSSVAFGLDSALMSRHLGMEVVNFGLYANLGTKLMMDLSRANINEGDIVVLAPELNDQTLSLYFNAESALQAADGNIGMLKNIDTDNYGAMLGALWKFVADKAEYIREGRAPVTDGAYSKECFNEYGDNIYDRPYNVTSYTAKTITLDYSYDKSDGIQTEYEDFVDYVREYSSFCKRRGASVYFSFAPMNEIALTDYNTKENIYAFYENLSEALGKDCTLISNINDYIMDEGYFFDSEFHLNNSGVTVRTVRLTDDIKRQMGRTDITMKPSELPPPSGYAVIDFEDGSEENLYFELQSDKDAAGNDVYYVVGLNDEGMKQNQLSIPNNIDGCPVVGIMPYFAEGSEARRIYVGKNVKSISSSAFGGAMHLSEIYIMRDDPRDISVPNAFVESGLITEGAPEDVKIFVKEEYLSLCKEDYFWGDYSFCLKGR